LPVRVKLTGWFAERADDLKGGYWYHYATVEKEAEFILRSSALDSIGLLLMSFGGEAIPGVYYYGAVYIAPPGSKARVSVMTRDNGYLGRKRGASLPDFDRAFNALFVLGASAVAFTSAGDSLTVTANRPRVRLSFEKRRQYAVVEPGAKKDFRRAFLVSETPPLSIGDAECAYAAEIYSAVAGELAESYDYVEIWRYGGTVALLPVKDMGGFRITGPELWILPGGGKPTGVVVNPPAEPVPGGSRIGYGEFVEACRGGLRGLLAFLEL